MPTKAESENRLLNAGELELVNATREPEIGALSLEQLKSISRRLREAHAKARDIAARQQREMRGKADPHGIRPAADNTGSLAKSQAILEAMQRLDAELLRRGEAGSSTPE
ncbi:hypothetical protein [Rhodoblastus sp.]|uniref:hypothetical protein n=1 Tax=Rhodoblastus sp. TaxID=1962975 RepID=UPI003F9479E9